MGRLIDVADLHIALGMGVLCGNKTAIQVINEAPTVEAIPKDQYEARLKADMVAMLTELKTEIEEVETFKNVIGWELTPKTPTNIKQDCIAIIQDKINELRGEKHEV